MKKYFALFMLLSVFLVGCQAAEPEVVCNDPYIVHGLDCCLDQNANSICDDDEVEDVQDVTGDITDPVDDDGTDEISTCIAEWETDPEYYDENSMLYVAFYEDVSEQEVKELLTLHGLDDADIEYEKDYDLYYILTEDDSIEEFIDFLDSQDGVRNVFESSIIGDDYKSYILHYTGEEKIIRLVTETGVDVTAFVYDFASIEIKQLKQDVIIKGYVYPEVSEVSEVLCSLKNDPNVFSVEIEALTSTATSSN